MSGTSSSFKNLALAPSLIQAVEEMGFSAMTPIQAQSIPILLEGRDLIGQSQTGSGKTAAFTLPLLQKIKIPSNDVQGLILCPTRELCAQVATQVRKLGRKQAGLKVVILSGGLPIGPQFGALEQGAHIAVGTPGRVMDHLRRGSLSLDRIHTAILDEADRMLEMGFREDMEFILGRSPESRQTILFSATFPKTIENMSRAFQRHPARVTVEATQQSLTKIRQTVFEVNPPQKLRTLIWLLGQHKPESAIVFCNLKAGVIEVAEGLERAGISSAAIHGDLDQYERDRVMARFRNASVRILVATDVAARGIDVPDLDVVFNYDMPAKPEIYVHRIGRTGRAGKAGTSVSLKTTRENSKIEALETLMGIKLIQKTAPDLDHLDIENQSVTEYQNAEAAMATLRISAGRKDKMRPGDILGALTGEAGGLNAADVGKIEIHDRHSFVAVRSQIASTALNRLRSGKIKGRRLRIDPI